MLTKLKSCCTIGLHAEEITVEVGVTPGEGTMTIVGLGDTAVQESKQRVRMAIRSGGFKLSTGKSITVNLAPADVRKSGPRFDLPIALGVIHAMGSVELSEDALGSTAFIGELALDGSLRHVSGVLPAAIACSKKGIERIVVPLVNAPEAALVPGLTVLGAESLGHVVRMLQGTEEPPRITPPASSPVHGLPDDVVDFADVRGQAHAKRALEIAAAGGHNVLLSGVPGAGKTLLARALRGILPPLSSEEAMEVTQIYSVANLLPAGSPLIHERPFRLVHHTASGVSIVGGGQVPGPGEISLAHRGVLFLDELAEFPSQVLDVLRQPIEDRRITITRAHGSVTFPADFTLVAAMNPGRFSAGGTQRIQRRISAPLLDRIDLTIAVEAVDVTDLQKKPSDNAETSAVILGRVVCARKAQKERFAKHRITTNKEMGVKLIDLLCPLNEPSQQLLRQAVERLGLSARAYHRTIKVARTIADLAGSEGIELGHVAEALQYRQQIDE